MKIKEIGRRRDKQFYTLVKVPIQAVSFHFALYCVSLSFSSEADQFWQVKSASLCLLMKDV